MAEYTFFAYDPAALTYDGNRGTFTLDPNYDYSEDRHFFEVTDNDTYFDGDRGADESGVDEDQTATVYDADGVVASGKVYVEQFAILEAPDGTRIVIDRIEIGGVNVGYVPSQPLEPGVAYDFIGTGNVNASYYDSRTGTTQPDTREEYDYYEANSVRCFTGGCLIETDQGPMPARWVREGVRVLTRDKGYQPVLWAGRTTIPHKTVANAPAIWPVSVAPDALDHLVAAMGPRRRMTVSPWHRILLDGASVQINMGMEAGFAAARHLIGAPGVTRERPRGDLTYVHLVLEGHAALASDGVWTESLFVPDASAGRILVDLPDEIGHRTMTLAYPALRKWEVRAMLGPVAGMRRNRVAMPRRSA